MTAIKKKMSATTTLLLLLILPASFLLSSSTTAFSDESLKDLSRLPHFQRIWLQRLDQQNKKNNNSVTSSSSRSFTSSTTISSTATWTDVSSTTDESLEQQVVDGDERVTTTIGPTFVSSSSSRNADAAVTTASVVTSVGKMTLTISEAKERLKARRIKSRKVKQTPTKEEEEDEEQHNNNQGHYHTKKMDSINIFRDETEEEAVEVKKHIQRMSNAGCSTPALRLVYVSQQHEASPNVRYLPACTWLHRCSDEIGCCTDDSKTCSASHIESVSLPFFVLTMSGSETKRTVTRLSFENHTACECVGRNSDLMPRTEPYISDARLHHSSAASSSFLLYDESNNNSDVEGKSSSRRHHENKKKSSSSSSSQTTKKRSHDDVFSSLQLGRVATVYSSTDPPASSSRLLFQQRHEQEEEEEDSTVAKRRFAGSSLVNPKNLNYSKNNNSSSSLSKLCRCPSGFTPIVSHRKRPSSSCGLCQCHDYHERNNRHHRTSSSQHHPASNTRHHHQLHRCGRLKRGLETFSPRDRGCMNEKKCATPECDYGRYVTSAGRCPRRNELRPRS